MLRALIFDVDGTIAETERDGHRVAFNRAFALAELDWNWSVELYGELLEVAGGKERIRFYIEKYKPDFRSPDDLDGWIASLHRAKTKHYRHLLLEGHLQLRPGIRRLLAEALREGIRLAIATTSAANNANTLLIKTLAPDSLSWFEVIAAGDIVPAKKPAPDIYRYVLEQMNLQPQDCLAIEDSQQGLASARAAELTTVVTVNNYTCDRDFAGAALVVSDLGEPEQPFAVLAGDAGNATYFDLALARYMVGD